MSLRGSLPFCVALCGAVGAPALAAQRSITRAQAVEAALARGARAAFGRADLAAATGALHGARLYPNPSLAATYTKDVPHYHVIADLALELPWIRAARIDAAASARDAVHYGVAFERAAIRFDIDTAYTRALAAAARARLSRRNALAADSLRNMAQLRREVGDVSELDVHLAAVNAGQIENAAADDSVAAVEALLAVQLAMGLPGDEVSIALADSLAPPPAEGGTAPAAVPLPVAAATANLRSAERALALAHRSVFAASSVQLGVERGDPAGLTDALLDLVARPDEIDEERLERSLGQFIARFLSAGTAADARMFADLFRIIAEYGLAIPPEIAAVFRALATLEGGLAEVAPGFDIIAEARGFAAVYFAERWRPEAIRETLAGELATLVPVLRRLPRRVDRIVGALERGRLGLNVRLFADDRDRRHVTGLLHQALLTIIGVSAGIMAVLLLSTKGGPQVTPTVSLYQLFAYNLLVVAAILVLRVLILIFRAD